MKITVALSLLALPVLMLLAGQASALPRDLSAVTAAASTRAPTQVTAAPQARDAVSLDQAVAMVRRQTGGRIIKANSTSSNGRTIHMIRVLTQDGKVFTVRVDAASGRIL